MKNKRSFAFGVGVTVLLYTVGMVFKQIGQATLFQDALIPYPFGSWLYQVSVLLMIISGLVTVGIPFWRDESELL